MWAEASWTRPHRVAGSVAKCAVLCSLPTAKVDWGEVLSPRLQVDVAREGLVL